MAVTQICPRCGAEFTPDGGLRNLCPRCLMQSVLHDSAEPVGGEEIFGSDRAAPRSDAGANGEDRDMAVTNTVLAAESEHPDPEPPRRLRDFRFQPGERVLDGFTLLAPLGYGGFGEVYHARSDAGKDVALKFVQRFLEVELRGVGHCLNLKHPNLVTVYDVRPDTAGQHWIVMEYVPGESLAEVIDRHPDGLPVDVVLHWLEGTVAGVEHLHQNGVVHRDLKPSNLFDDRGTVKVGDYGLSKFITASRRSGQTQSVGTLHYMAPEIGGGRYGREVDVYAVGVMLYEMLTGRVPFDGQSPAEILMKHLTAPPDLSAVPPAFRGIVARMLAKRPDERYVSLQAVLADVKARLADDALVGAEPDSDPAYDAASVYSSPGPSTWLENQFAALRQPPSAESSGRSRSASATSSPSRIATVLWLLAAMLLPLMLIGGLDRRKTQLASMVVFSAMLIWLWSSLAARVRNRPSRSGHHAPPPGRTERAVRQRPVLTTMAVLLTIAFLLMLVAMVRVVRTETDRTEVSAVRTDGDWMEEDADVRIDPNASSGHMPVVPSAPVVRNGPARFGDPAPSLAPLSLGLLTASGLGALCCWILVLGSHRRNQPSRSREAPTLAQRFQFALSESPWRTWLCLFLSLSVLAVPIAWLTITKTRDTSGEQFRPDAPWVYAVLLWLFVCLLGSGVLCLWHHLMWGSYRTERSRSQAAARGPRNSVLPAILRTLAVLGLMFLLAVFVYFARSSALIFMAMPVFGVFVGLIVLIWFGGSESRPSAPADPTSLDESSQSFPPWLLTDMLGFIKPTPASDDPVRSRSLMESDRQSPGDRRGLSQIEDAAASEIRFPRPSRVSANVAPPREVGGWQAFGMVLIAALGGVGAGLLTGGVCLSVVSIAQNRHDFALVCGLHVGFFVAALIAYCLFWRSQSSFLRLLAALFWGATMGLFALGLFLLAGWRLESDASLFSVGFGCTVAGALGVATLAGPAGGTFPRLVASLLFGVGVGLMLGSTVGILTGKDEEAALFGTGSGLMACGIAAYLIFVRRPSRPGAL